MKLSDRLSLIKDMVSPCNTVCDVGCDHGYISIALISEGIAKHAIACDINKGPLERANENIVAAGLTDKIETRLSDGLHNISASDNVDSIVIAGMGGRLTLKILQEGISVARCADHIVIEPQSELELVRKTLREMKMTIVREKFVIDMSKPYWIMDINPQTAPDEGKSAIAPKKDAEAMTAPDKSAVPITLSEIYDCYSQYLLEENSNVYRDYLSGELLVNREMLQSIGNINERLVRKCKILEEALKMMN